MTRARDIPADPRSRNQALCTLFFPVAGCLRGIWFCRRLKRDVLRMRSRENEGSLRRFIRHKGTAFQSRYLFVPSRRSRNAPRYSPSFNSQRARKIRKTKLQNKTRNKLLYIGNDFSSIERASRLVVFQAHRQHFVCRIAACPWSSVVSSRTYLSLYSSPLVCTCDTAKRGSEKAIEIPRFNLPSRVSHVASAAFRTAGEFGMRTKCVT